MHQKDKPRVTESGKRFLLTAFFLVVIFSVGLSQVAVDVYQGKTPGVIDLFRQMPSKASLRAFEDDLERDSWFAQTVRPWMQRFQYVAFKDAGEEALVGRDGWLFYKPGAAYLTQRPVKDGESAEAVRAMVSFRDQLRARDIQLLIVPVPGKASVYPDRLSSRADQFSQPINQTTLNAIAALREAEVEVVDLGAVFREARAVAEEEYYLAQDTHWTPQGMRLAAKTVADRLLALGWVAQGRHEYDLKPAPLQRHGDILEMMQVPQMDRYAAPEVIECTQVIARQTGAPYQDDAASEILVLGDSFLRIYESDAPGSGGFIAHLAYELRFPLTSIVNDGGASTLVRQELSRKPALLENKRVVIWEFVERDIRFGMEGWQEVPLPSLP